MVPSAFSLLLPAAAFGAVTRPEHLRIVDDVALARNVQDEKLPAKVSRKQWKRRMEPVTHFLTGAVLARAGFTRQDRIGDRHHGTRCGGAGHRRPVVCRWFCGRLRASSRIHAHADRHPGCRRDGRGLFVSVDPVVHALFVHANAHRPAGEAPPSLPARWKLLSGLACLAGYSHLLLDFTNNYGIRTCSGRFRRSGIRGTSCSSSIRSFLWC